MIPTQEDTSAVKGVAKLFQCGRFELAVKQLNKAMIAGKSSWTPFQVARAYVLLGDCYQNLGLRKGAYASYIKAHKTDANLPELRIRLATMMDPRPFSYEEQAELMDDFAISPEHCHPFARALDGAFGTRVDTVYASDNLIAINLALSFLRDEPFMESMAKSSKGFSAKAQKTWRSHILVWAARNALLLDGDFVELGVYNGHYSPIVARAINLAAHSDRTFWLYDTFAGLPDDTDWEDRPGKEHYDNVQKYYSDPKLYDLVKSKFEGIPNVKIIKGKVPDTLYEHKPGKIAYLHLDMNSGVHEVAALEYLYDDIAPGACIVLDDFGSWVFEKQRCAHQKFFGDKNIPIAELPTGQGLVIKPATET